MRRPAFHAEEGPRPRSPVARRASNAGVGRAPFQLPRLLRRDSARRGAGHSGTPGIRHWAPEHPLLWMLVWRDTCEEQLGRAGSSRSELDRWVSHLSPLTGHFSGQVLRDTSNSRGWQTRRGARKTPARGSAFGRHRSPRRASARDPSGGDAFDGGCVADAAFHWSWRVNARMSLTSRSGAWREAKCPPRSYSVQRTMSCERSARVRIEVSPGNTATAVGTPDGLPPDALHRPAHTCPASTRRKQAHPAAGHPRRDGCRLESLKPPSTAAANYRSDPPQSMADPAPQRRLALLYRTCSLRIWPKSG